MKGTKVAGFKLGAGLKGTKVAGFKLEAHVAAVAFTQNKTFECMYQNRLWSKPGPR